MTSPKPCHALSSTAMILGAGFGTRLHPLTQDIPKPLVMIGGESLLSYHLHHLQRAGCEHVLVNAHYKWEKMEEFLKNQTALPYTLSLEETILNTGGGIAKAMYHEQKPFFVVNSDAYTIGNLAHTYPKLEQVFDPQHMDALLLLCPKKSIQGYEGQGDFILNLPHTQKNDTVHFFKDYPTHPPLVYVGIQIINAQSFQKFLKKFYPLYCAQDNAQYPPFSIMEFWKNAHDQNRLCGYRDDQNTWFDTGNLKGLSLARNASSPSSFSK